MTESCKCPKCGEIKTDPVEVEFIGWFGLCIDCEWSRLDA